MLDAFTSENLPDVGGALGRFAAYVAVEAAMAHARLDLASELVGRLGEGLWTGFDHPYDAMVVACRVRLLAFRGEITAARSVLDTAPGPAPGPPAAMVVAATECLVRGNDAEPAEVRRLAGRERAAQ